MTWALGQTRYRISTGYFQTHAFLWAHFRITHGKTKGLRDTETPTLTCSEPARTGLGPRPLGLVALVLAVWVTARGQVGRARLRDRGSWRPC